MSKTILSDDPDGSWGQVQLESDVGPFIESDEHPRMAIWTRSVVGHDQDGNRVYEWEKLAEDVHVAMYQSRRELVDGIELLRVKVIGLTQDTIDSESSMAISFGDVDDPTEVKLSRIESVFQNGVRLEIEAERVL